MDKMDKAKLTRAEAIELVGERYVEAVEALSCEPTGRCYYHDEDEVEWSAQIEIDVDELTDASRTKLDVCGDCWLRAVYYTDAEDAARAKEPGGNWDAVKWEVHHYEIVG